MPINDAEDPLRPHRHDPNPHPPTTDPSFVVRTAWGAGRRVSLADLDALPQVELAGCFIVSTSHGTTGPFTFGGVSLLTLLEQSVSGPWQDVGVVSADGFGNRILRAELERPDSAGLILIATRIDGRKMTRREGLVRLIVPSERDDALRQVKWVAQVTVR